MTTNIDKLDETPEHSDESTASEYVKRAIGGRTGMIDTEWGPAHLRDDAKPFEFEHTDFTD